MSSRYILYILLFVIFHSGIAQKYSFNTFNRFDGLAQDYVYDITQDKNGLLWIATGEGVSVFDGKNFENYKEEDGLFEDFTNSIFIDSKGRKWLGHYTGNISIIEEDTVYNIATNLAVPILKIIEDNSGRIWFATQGKGLAYLNDENQISLLNDREKIKVSDIFILDSLLIFSSSLGLKIVTTNENKIEERNLNINKDVQFSLIGNTSSDTMFLLSNEGKLALYHHKSKFFKIIPFEKQAVPNNVTDFIKIKDAFWVSTLGEGVRKYEISEDSLRLKTVFNQSSGLTSNYIKSLFLDIHDNIWVGSYGYGLCSYRKNRFVYYPIENEEPNSYIDSDKNKIILVGKKGGYEMQLNRDKTFKKFYSCPSNQKINFIKHGSSSDKYYISLEKSGLIEYNKSTKKTSVIYSENTNNLTNQVNNVLKTKSATLWIATRGGAFKIDKDNHKTYYNMSDGLSHNNIYKLFEDSNGKIWFATRGSGITCYDNGEFYTYNSPALERGIDISAFHEDLSNNIWISTYGQGVFKFNGEGFDLIFSKENGLESNFIYHLHTDNIGNLWLVHNEFLSVINLEKNYITKRSVTEGYNIKTNILSTTVDPEDNIWLATNVGVFKGSIKDLGQPNPIPSTLITKVRQNYKPLIKRDLTYFLDKDGEKMPVFSHNENHFTFSFIGVNYQNRDDNTYKYMLKGLDSKWSLPIHEEFVTYSQLPPGKYSFQVKSASSERGPFSKIDEYKFIIEPPYWNKWPFRIGVILISSIFLYAIFYWRTKSLESQKIKLESDKEKLTTEIEERKVIQSKLLEREEQLRATNDELNTFLYKASHDLKGPLATVSGLANIALLESKDELIKKYFKMINTSLENLDLILRNLTQVTDIKNEDLRVEEVNLEEIIHEILILIKDRNGDNTMINTHTLKDITIKTDRKLLFSVIFNLLDNAVKFTPENPNINLHVLIENNKYIIQIIDNGIGVMEEFKDKIFDMFFKASTLSKSSGLGLYIVRNAIEKLEGEIDFTNNVSGGTTFTVKLPIR